jgi:Na+-driven multidrug efflux pump
VASPSTDAESSALSSTRSGALGIIVACGGVFLAAWVSGGRILFGVDGSLTLTYALTVGVAFVVLYLFAGVAILRTARRGYRTRPATIATVLSAWGCGILLGWTIPDITPIGLQTILTGATEPGLGIVIGLSNPLGIIMLGLSVTALVLANIDARGGPRVLEED